jgi:hypothetical protein
MGLSLADRSDDQLRRQDCFGTMTCWSFATDDPVNPVNSSRFVLSIYVTSRLIISPTLRDLVTDIWRITGIARASARKGPRHILSHPIYSSHALSGVQVLNLAQLQLPMCTRCCMQGSSARELGFFHCHLDRYPRDRVRPPYSLFLSLT